MSTTTTTRPSPRGPWSPRSPPRNISVPSTTPLGFPAKTPGQPTPGRAAKTLSPHAARPQPPSSPNYFEYVTDPNSNPPNSNAGIHAKKNWSPPPSAGMRPGVATPSSQYPLESHPRFETFRRQSETNTFNLSHASLSQFSASPMSGQPSTIEDVTDQSHRRRSAQPVGLQGSTLHGEGTTLDRMDLDSSPEPQRPGPNPLSSSDPSYFDAQRLSSQPNVLSPANVSNDDFSSSQRTEISHVDERHPRNSLPNNRIDPPSGVVQRSETLPSSISTDGPTMISPQDFVGLLKGHLPQDLLLLDLRVSQQYSKSRIRDALNLCIPTTLLKRASFNIQRLSDTFTREHEKSKFAQWRSAKFIIVYDANSMQLKDATSSINTLKKFSSEKWHGATLILRGGFDTFAKKFPEQIDKTPANEMNGSDTRKLSIDPPSVAPVAGGCMMPNTQTAANPFFGSIRQNMDLIGGVGQMPVKLPSGLKESAVTRIPTWLRKVSSANDNGKTVADRFLGIEKAEQHRMQKALSTNVTYGSPNPLSPEAVQIAGIEKGTKNRYKDMLPYDHSRVKLQGVESGGCDYVNASHIKAQWSNKHYIASQAPVPATFQDFWRVAWEQDARVIVMLTAESEGGQRKCHPYWLPGDYGPFKLKAISERHVGLEHKKPNRSLTSPVPKPDAKDRRPDMGGRRRSTNYASQYAAAPSPPIDLDVPHVIVRKLTLSHANHPFEPLREITQLQYSSWPDFGAPAHPAHVLGLVEHCSSVVQSYQPSKSSRAVDEPARENERPIVVHCSAGCGRTGTFCTVDSVVDMLKRQRQARTAKLDGKGAEREDYMAVDTKEDNSWMLKDDEDLVAKTVSDFRAQRLSMVQTLRQFVLCYEAVLEWIVDEMPDKYKGLGGGSGGSGSGSGSGSGQGDKDRWSWGGSPSA